MKHFALIPLAALALTGCITYDNTGDGITRAQFGQTANVGEVKVTPVKLLEDSRCPEGVQCVWAGQVRISAIVTWKTRVQNVEMTQGKPVAIANGMLELVEVMPRKQANVTLYPDDYRFGFRYTAGM